MAARMIEEDNTYSTFSTLETRVPIKWNMNILERRNLDCFGPMREDVIATQVSWMFSVISRIITVWLTGFNLVAPRTKRNLCWLWS